MVQVAAFRGLRYDLGHVGSLSDVVAPPYDVIDEAHQNALYKRHPANVIRLILNRPEPGDGVGDERYERAARFLRNWMREGVLATESDPALYVYHQVFRYDDQECVRRGFMGRVRLERFGEGAIYPHEETHAAAKADRLKLTTACRANVSQIFGLYPDSENVAQGHLESAVAGVAPLEATDDLGVTHRIWPVTDVRVIGAVSSAMADRPVFVADGHHRYETACNYRDGLAEEGDLGDEHPANYVLMMCVSMSDPGMIVLPTHRLFRGLPALSSDELIQRLGNRFDTELVGEGPDLASSVWARIEEEDEQGMLGLYTEKDGRWLLARVSEGGRTRMGEIASDHSESWRGLGVSLLQRLVLEDALGATDLPKPDYVHRVDEVVEGLENGDEEGEAYPLGALVMPATLDHVRDISEFGERMPAKSTYFYPKLLCGLVINPLE